MRGCTPSWNLLAQYGKLDELFQLNYKISPAKQSEVNSPKEMFTKRSRLGFFLAFIKFNIMDFMIMKPNNDNNIINNHRRFVGTIIRSVISQLQFVITEKDLGTSRNLQI